MGLYPTWKMLMEVADWKEGMQVIDWGSCPIYDPLHRRAYQKCQEDVLVVTIGMRVNQSTKSSQFGSQLQFVLTVSLPSFLFHLCGFPFSNCSVYLPTSNPDPTKSVPCFFQLIQEETEVSRLHLKRLCL